MNAKSMRGVDELLAEIASGKSDLTPDEERLVDRITFSHTGKRFGRFKREKNASDLNIPTISKDTGTKAARERALPKQDKPGKGGKTVTRQISRDIPIGAPVVATGTPVVATESPSEPL